MGYTLPYKPVEAIQYDNRMNFNSRRAVAQTEPLAKIRPVTAEQQAFRDQQKEIPASLQGKGKHIDESI